MGTTSPALPDFFQALGPIDDLPPQLQRALEPGPDFAPLPTPGPHGWLAIHEESGQSFDDFRSSATLPGPLRNRIYIQPLDDLPPGSSWDLTQLEVFTRAFFGLDARVLPPLSLESRAFVTRRAPDSPGMQVYAGGVLSALFQHKPADSYCLVGITGRDICPSAIVTYAFGVAVPSLRVGLCSVARYGLPFCRQVPGHTAEDMRCRCCKLVVHEIGHLIGLQHCVFFQCLMNGSSDLLESDARPMHLCPLDLRKVQWALGFDVGDRYRRLRSFWADAGADDETRWIDRRLAHVTGHHQDGH